MNRFIKFLCIALILSVFFIQDGYAFWGKKKTKAKAQEKTTKEAVAEKKKETKKQVKQEEKVEKKEEKPAPVETTGVKKQRSPEELKRIKKEKMLRKKRRKQLDNTRWTIEVKASEKGAKAEVDELIFKDNRFQSESSSQNGFSATNYTISIKGDSVIWETMQTAESGEINFWRGDISEDMESMRGMTSKKLPDGTTTNYSFTSKSKKAIE